MLRFITARNWAVAWLWKSEKASDIARLAHIPQISPRLNIYPHMFYPPCLQWIHRTLAMRTWRLRLTTVDGKLPSAWRAGCRYLLAWAWFMPALVSLQLSGLKGSAPAVVTVLVGVVAYALLALLLPQKQYLHDLVCGTRLVNWQAAPRP